MMWKEEMMVLNKFDALVLDFDGVLADSVEVKTKAFALLYGYYGPEIVAKVVDHHRRNGGMARTEIFKHYHNAFLGQPLDESGLENLCNRFSQLVVDEVVEAEEIPGAGAFLSKSSRVVPCFVVSATPEEEI